MQTELSQETDKETNLTKVAPVVIEETVDNLYNSLAIDMSIFDPENGHTYNTKFTPEQKVMAVVWYAVTGNMRETARRTGIERHTIMFWKQKPWFHIILDQIRKIRNDSLDAKLSQIMDVSADELLDRVQQGDYTLTKEGDIIRIPLKAKDLALAGLSIPMERRTHLRGEDKAKVEKKAVEKVLNNLFDQFIKISQRTKQQEPIEAEYTEITNNG